MSRSEAADRDRPEALYLEARRREGRLLSPEAARQLPEVERSSPLAAEWAKRRDSLGRVLRHLQRHPRRGPLLDLGCGVGWMTARLAADLDRPVVGLDTNERELEVARTAFGNDGRVRFVGMDLWVEEPPGAPFSTVVIAAAFQYFPDLESLFLRLSEILVVDGEILLLDSPIYSPKEVAAARRRSRSYYERLGVPAMANHYHHHEWSGLAPFHPTVLYRPRPWRLRLGRWLRRPVSPFPIVRLQVLRPQ